jgi:uncharacterized membrane protein
VPKLIHDSVVIFAGAMVGFCFARISFLNVGGDASSSYKNTSATGEWYHYRSGHRRVGITLHLATCLPAGLLLVFQFVPAIRHHFLIFHRINGYVVIILTLLSTAGALMIARTAFGGGLDIQSAVGTLALMVVVSISLAYYNIKRYQIDQHRAWMLRTMFYMGVIITERIIMVIAAAIITRTGGYWQVSSCDKVLFIHDGNTQVVEDLYPQCADRVPGDNPRVIVAADMTGGLDEGIAASLGLSFGMASWIAIFLHAVGVEIYLNLTTTEGERLRNVSYQKQLEAGLQHPGSAGLTADRIGDVPKWRPED